MITKYIRCSFLTWHHIDDDISGVKVEIGLIIGYRWERLNITPFFGHAKISCPRPFKQIPAEVKAGIWISHIKLIVSRLFGELTQQIWIDHAGVTLMKYQISGSNIDQPTEDTGG